MLGTGLILHQERKIALEKSRQSRSQHSYDSTKQSPDKNDRAHFCLSKFSEDSVKALKNFASASLGNVWSLPQGEPHSVTAMGLSHQFRGCRGGNSPSRGGWAAL